jgi:hypothetical protein
MCRGLSCGKQVALVLFAKLDNTDYLIGECCWVAALDKD